MDAESNSGPRDAELSPHQLSISSAPSLHFMFLFLLLFWLFFFCLFVLTPLISQLYLASISCPSKTKAFFFFSFVLFSSFFYISPTVSSPSSLASPLTLFCISTQPPFPLQKKNRSPRGNSHTGQSKIQ